MTVELHHPNVGDRIIDKTFPKITRAMLALYAGASGDHNPIQSTAILRRWPDLPTSSHRGCW
jgi:hypothetical protein